VFNTVETQKYSRANRSALPGSGRTERRVRTVIVDDHPLFRRGLREVIEEEHSLELVAEADNGVTGLDLIGRQATDIAILDINLPGMSGLDIVRKLAERRSPVKVVILTMHKDEEIFQKALALGVRGYVLKDNAVSDIVNCLKAVAAGDYYLTPSLSAYVVRRHQAADALAAARPALSKVTTAERRILKLVAENKTSKEIAKVLFISYRTVEAHRTNICAKLQLHGSHRLLEFALRHAGEL
jgi:DNA-binding NarL/FixJ family response regulator